MPKSQRPDGVVTGGSKRLASRLCQMKTGHCLTGQHLHWTKNRAHPSVLVVVPVPGADPGSPFQGVPRVGAPAEDPVGSGVEGDREG